MNYIIGFLILICNSIFFYSCKPPNKTSSLSVSNQLTHQVKSVYYFGAKGDGVTDDSKAFVKAINTGYLYIPKGTFKVKNLSLINNLSIVCESSKSIIEGVTKNDVIFKNAKHGSNLEFTGGTWRNAKAVILHEGNRSLNSSTFSDLTIINCTIGMAFSSSVGNTFQNIKFIKTITGLFFGRNGKKNVHNINTIKGCKFYQFEKYGIYFENNSQKKSNNIIEDCWLEQSKGTGIFLGNNCYSTIIQNSYFERLGFGDTDREITIGETPQSFCPGTKILNNAFKRSKAGSKISEKILVHGVSDITVEGNEVYLLKHQKFIKLNNSERTHSFIKNNQLIQIQKKNTKTKLRSINSQKRLFDRSGNQKVTYSLQSSGSGQDSFKEFKEGQSINKIYRLNSSHIPSIREGNIFTVTKGKPITNFEGGINGLRITIIAQGNRKIKNNKNISLDNGIDFQMKSDCTLTLLYIGSKWIEISRKN